MSASAAPLGLLDHAGCCGSWLSWLGRTVGCLSLLEACMQPSRTSKSSLHRESIQVSSAQGTLGPVSEAYGVFSNRDLTIHHWRAAKDNSKNLCVFGVSWVALNNESKEGFSCLILGVLLDGSLALILDTIYYNYLCMLTHGV